MNKLIVAIDGPAGAGKSTVARLVAQRLDYVYIDTGAMYRAVTLEAMRHGVELDDEEKVAAIANNIDLAFAEGNTVIKVDGQDITEAIRTPEVSRLVSRVSQIGGVRRAMVNLQRQLASQGGVVLDGRDIGNHVLPHADVKVFLTASIQERAKRRWLEMLQKGYKVELDELAEEIACRDRMDCEREISPLVKAADAMLIDTTSLSVEGAVDSIIELCWRAGNGGL